MTEYDRVRVSEAKGKAKDDDATKPLSSQAREVDVGSYLPPSPSDPYFVLFKASLKDTSSLRVGNESCRESGITEGRLQLLHL
ncbi:hypothetical protein Ddye_022355 [Dipteronia dyeriana]|uniref:Uncharacterized protein n=1 Tax=Dipteronia dyeriana TaxID=168575 RepID=A0AAD9WYV2_9ROSI|nr:hypothetical protein Ddye_022355 [Dipteronia dyeriana]